MAGINPVSDSVSVATNGDVGAAVVAWFAERGSDAAKKVQRAMDKAERDSKINKKYDEMDSEGITTSDGNTKFPSNGPNADLLRTMGNDPKAKALLSKIDGGKALTPDEVKELHEITNSSKENVGSVDGLGAVQDDSVNTTLVQLAAQEFTTAINSMSSAGKAFGDLKKSIGDRMQ